MIDILPVMKRLLLNRGYTLLNIELHSVRAITQDGRKVQCVYLPRCTTHTLKHYYTLFQKAGIRVCMIVYTDMTSPAKKISSAFHIQFFHSSELMANPIDHVYYSRHELTNKEEHPEMNKYPILSSNDSITRYYGFQSGQLVKITRPDKSVCFRRVV